MDKTFPIVNLIGPTSDDTRDVMVLGESGVLACCRDLSARIRARLGAPSWPIAIRLFSAEEPEPAARQAHDTLVRRTGGWRHADAFEQACSACALAIRHNRHHTRRGRSRSSSNC